MCNSLFFMKTKTFFLVAVTCLLILTGCKDEKPEYGSPISVKVYGVNGRLNLKVGFMLGLTVSDPVKADNVPLTVSSNGSIVPDKEIKWGYDQSASSRFFAYSPYDASFTGQEIVTIQAPVDQSTAEKLLKGNLMTAVASGNPSESAVTMKLQHAMTAMALSFDNRTGERITSVTASGFMTEGKLNILTGVLTATGNKLPITPLRSPNDDNSFVFIYIPQDVTPVFKVTLSSGRTIAFTFNNYCHEYPGRVIKMDIQIDEKTPEANILDLDGVNILQWTTNDLPPFPADYQYMTLSELNQVEPDANDDNFFVAYLKSVTVTAVDRSNQDVFGVILEDKTKAIHVWTYLDSPLKVGNTIVGPIMGYMDKPSDDEFHISYFYTKYATIGKADELPCTTGTFSGILDNLDDWEYRRMEFKDVTLKEPFEKDRAVFVQNNTSISVVCPGISVSLSEGVKGNLIGFPVRSGSEIIIMVYDESQFDSFSKDPSDDLAITRADVYGWYDISDPDTAVCFMNGSDTDLQYSIRYYSSGRSMQVADLHNGEVHWAFLYDCIKNPVAGHMYTVAFNAAGKTVRQGYTMEMECVKVQENTAWLVDSSGKTGLVLAL